MSFGEKNLNFFPGLSALLKKLQFGVNELQAFDLENDYNYMYELYEQFNKSLQTNNWEEDSQLF